MKTLNELFDRPAKYTTRKQMGFRFYEWKIGDMKYTLRAQKSQFSEAWNVLFVSEDKYGQIEVGTTGTGNEIQVFATVVKIMKEFVKKVKPLAIEFTAKSGARSGLYDKMVKRFASGFKITTDTFTSPFVGSTKRYKLTKNENS